MTRIYGALSWRQRGCGGEEVDQVRFMWLTFYQIRSEQQAAKTEIAIAIHFTHSSFHSCWDPPMELLANVIQNMSLFIYAAAKDAHWVARPDVATHHRPLVCTIFCSKSFCWGNCCILCPVGQEPGEVARADDMFAIKETLNQMTMANGWDTHTAPQIQMQMCRASGCELSCQTSPFGPKSALGSEWNC